MTGRNNDITLLKLLPDSPAPGNAATFTMYGWVHICARNLSALPIIQSRQFSGRANTQPSAILAPLLSVHSSYLDCSASITLRFTDSLNLPSYEVIHLWRSTIIPGGSRDAKIPIAYN